MSKLNIYIYSGIGIVLFSLILYIVFLKKDNTNLVQKLEIQKLLTINKEQNIIDLKNTISDQNKKIQALAKKQQEAVDAYKEWEKKEDKYKKDIQDILNTKGNSSCETLQKRLEKIKLRGYEGL